VVRSRCSDDENLDFGEHGFWESVGVRSFPVVNVLLVEKDVGPRSGPRHWRFRLRKPVASAKPADVNERCGKVADHSVVRSRCSGDENLDFDELGVRANLSASAGSRWWPYCWLTRTLDHGVVHDFGDSAHEPAASAKPADVNKRCGIVADHSVVRSRCSGDEKLEFGE
jgi:hypothetical protein